MPIGGREPRWPAAAALLAMGVLRLTLPPYLEVGPRWLMLLVVGLLLVPTVTAHRLGYRDWNRALGLAVAALVSLFLLFSLVLLVENVDQPSVAPTALLRAAAALWATNVLVFALWYWHFDAGGPHEREDRGRHHAGAFLFPQMAVPDPTWMPQFVDYVYVSFNQSAAFSPTDTAVLARWAKLLGIVQASISLLVIVLLVGRGVNRL